MWFRETYSLQGIHIGGREELPITISLPKGREGELIIRYRNFSKEKQIPSQLYCDALLWLDVKPKITSMFDSLAENKLPVDKTMPIKLPYSLSFESKIDEHGQIPEKHIIPLSILPLQFQDLANRARGELTNYIRSFVKTMRWAQAADCPHSPLGFVSYHWSADKKNWFPMPSDLAVEAHLVKPFNFNSASIEPVLALWQSEEEPLAHELIREAFDVAHLNKRSALLIGVSALEIAVKEYVMYLVPYSYDILKKMSSPPILQLVQEVIPSIQKAKHIENSHFPYDKETADFIKKWVSIRNQVAHGAKDNSKVNRVVEFLNFVQDELYRIDYCRGHEWAKPLPARNSILRP